MQFPTTQARGETVSFSLELVKNLQVFDFLQGKQMFSTYSKNALLKILLVMPYSAKT